MILLGYNLRIIPRMESINIAKILVEFDTIPQNAKANETRNVSWNPAKVTKIGVPQQPFSDCAGYPYDLKRPK
jgi:hypothetical protein